MSNLFDFNLCGEVKEDYSFIACSHSDDDDDDFIFEGDTCGWED